MAKDELPQQPGTTSPGLDSESIWWLYDWFKQKKWCSRLATLTNDVNNVPSCMCTYVFHIEIVWKWLDFFGRRWDLGDGISKYCRCQLLKCTMWEAMTMGGTRKWNAFFFQCTFASATAWNVWFPFPRKSSNSIYLSKHTMLNTGSHIWISFGSFITPDYFFHSFSKCGSAKIGMFRHKKSTGGVLC